MGSVGSSLEKGFGNLAKIDPIASTVVHGGYRSPSGLINTMPKKEPNYDSIGLNRGPGQASETDAAALHDRYAGTEAINAYRNSRSAETNQLIGQAMAQSKGLDAAENSAIRNNAMAAINSQNQGALRALRASQGANGIRGGLATAQQQQQLGRGGQAVASMERDLAADNINYKREGTKTAAELVSNQENVERDLAAQKLNTILAIRQENAALTAAEMQAKAAAMAGQSGGGGKGGGK